MTKIFSYYPKSILPYLISNRIMNFFSVAISLAEEINSQTSSQLGIDM